MNKLILLFSLLFTTHTFAKNELLTFASDINGFPAPGLCYFSNNKLVPHKTGFLTNYTCFNGPDIHGEIWFVSPTGNNKLLFTAEEGRLLTDPITDGGKIYSLEYTEVDTKFLHSHDLVTAKKEAIPWANTHVNSISLFGDSLWLRYRDENGNFGEGTWKSGVWTKSPSRGVSYFFNSAATPKMLVHKIRMGAHGEIDENRPDVIQVRLAPSFNTVDVLKDQDADPSSPFLWFANYIVANGDQWLVISKTSTQTLAIVGKRTSYKTIPLDGTFKNIDQYPGALTDKGNLVLRATHRDGRYGVWIYRNGKFDLILSEGNEITYQDQTIFTAKPLFYTAPVAQGESVLVGVGLSDGTKLIGQGVIRITD